MKKITFLVDGFNLYHSVREVQKKFNSSTKWLDIQRLCNSRLPAISPFIGGRSQIESIYYFSAYAHHLSDPGIVVRHKNFVKCLENTGIHVEINKFKFKEIKCPFCKRMITRHEEKKTDVSIALKLIEVFMTNECDAAVLITGDTDLAPAVKMARNFFPDKHVSFAFPAFRKNKELSRLCPESTNINPKQYTNCQFPDPYTLKDGSTIEKPSSW